MSKIAVEQNEWIRVLGKGMITIPKKWRDELEIEEGAIIKAKKIDQKVIIESTQKASFAPYRIYSRTELNQFLEDDKL